MRGWSETLRGMVFPMHCDHMNHVNNRWYAHFFDDASLSQWSRIGLTEKALRDTHHTSAVIAHTSVDFLHELVASDQFLIRSAFTRLGNKSVTLQQVLEHCDNGNIAAKQTMIAVFFDATGRSSTAIPDSVRAIIEPLLTNVEP